MELRLVRYFVAVAEELNVTRAAERLHTAQPSLSQQIRQLEEMIGAPLFYREKHRLRLTETGQTFLPGAREILALVEQVFNQTRATARKEVGTIVLGMVPGPEKNVFSYLLPFLLKYYPDIKLHLRTMTAPEQIQALQRREITAGFLRGPIRCDEIASEIFMRENVVAVLPENSDLARLERIPVPLLAEIPLIPISHDVAPAVHDVVGKVEARTGIKFKIGFCTENLMTSMNAVASGLGFSFFASYVEEIVPKGVVTRPIDLDPPPTLDLLFAYRKDDRLPALERLVALVREHSPRRCAGATEESDGD